ncbi:hypothetical protein PINS_up013185 [Pythium insidiosum]|nr:hypothetical protein PINS_up013185 [Pythium insidiosum]
MFHVIRHVTELSDSDAHDFVMSFASQLARVPRFSMSVMFLSDKEKDDCKWVLDKLAEVMADNDECRQQITTLQREYGVL